MLYVCRSTTDGWNPKQKNQSKRSNGSQLQLETAHLLASTEKTYCLEVCCFKNSDGVIARQACALLDAKLPDSALTSYAGSMLGVC